MTIKSEYIEALMKLGYTERESQFLYIVATHSGHFLRRQFTQFIGMERGGTDNQFIRKAIAQGHVHEFAFRQDNYTRYHLFSRIVYRAIDKESSRNRKAGSDAKANLKLKILDFVLDNLEEEYLEEEDDKVQFFAVTKGISRDLLPARAYESKDGKEETTRYFIDKFPLFFSKPETDSKPILTFTYFQDDFDNSRGFAAHLNWYKSLLKALDEPYRFLYVANEMRHFQRAEKQFHAVLSTGNGQPYFPPMLTYFRLRQLWEAKKLEKLTDTDYVALNRGEKKFTKPEHERMYQQWLKGELPNKNDAAPQAQPHHESRGTFETYWLRT